MASRMTTFTFSILILLLPLLLYMCLHCFQPFSVAQAYLPSFTRNFCSPSTFQTKGYTVDLAALLSSLHLHSSSARYYYNSTGSTSLDTVYAVFQCRGDLTLLQCSQCVSFAINASAQKCPRAVNSRIDIDTCTLIYQNETITENFDVVFYILNKSNATDATFRSNRDEVLTTVSTAAPSHGGYYASYVGKSITEGVYALAQCNGYLSQPDCLRCLSQVSNVQRDFGDVAGVRMYYGSCYYRFETYLFYAETPAPTTSPLQQSAPPNFRTGETGNKLILIGAIVGWSLLVLVVCTFLGFLKRKKRNDRQKETRAALRRQQSIELQPDLQHQIRLFSLKQLERATGNFHDENKLGEGGFGSVYKGTLEDGQCVAIKKLSNPSHRGERQFLSEVKLLTNVQHRNLITLLGCCVEGSQRLLIYEYIRNQSLDKHLFVDVHGLTPLNWSTRRDIIIGTAKGLAYLHEDSQVRIVHRDIKAANILLDENFHPKISDFGLARLFDLDKTHFGTSVSVAGTLGYLAPEYAIHGQFTEKADIFSYGLVVLEILSGRRKIDNRLPPEQQRLLQWTWGLYQERRQLELMDPLLRDNYFVEEAIRMVHVAFLCTQAVAGLRPAMSKVVAILMGRSEILEIPTSPPFLIGSIDEMGLGSANDDQNHLQTSPLYVPPPSDSRSSGFGSDSYSMYAPLVAGRSLSGANSISDVLEPR